MPAANARRKPSPLRSGDTLAPFGRCYDLDARTLDLENRTVECVFSTETDQVERWFGIEILDHSDGAVRMERINAGAPFLMDHDRGDQRGAIEPGSATIHQRQGRCLLRFSRNARGEELMQDVADGIRTQVSVGYRVHRMVLEEERQDGPDVYRATEWEPFEVSSVAMGFDPDAGIRGDSREDAAKAAETLFGKRAARLASRVTVENHATPPTKPPPTMTKKQKERREAELRAIARENGVSDDDLKRALDDLENVSPEDFRAAHVPEENDSAEDTPAARQSGDAPEKRQKPEKPAPARDDSSALSREDVRSAVRSERERVEEINALAREFGIPEASTEKGQLSARSAIQSDMTVEDFKLGILEAQRNDPVNGPVPLPRGDADADLMRQTPAGEPGTMERTLNEWNRQAVTRLREAGFRDVPEPKPVRTFQSTREVIGGPNILIHRSLTGVPNLADVSALDAGIGSPVIGEAIGESPEVAVFPVDTIAGSTVELSVRTGLPTVGFRDANEGRDYKKGTFEPRLFQTMVIEEPIGVDIQGVLNASANPGRVLAAEAAAVTQAVVQHIGVQTWYGGTAQSDADAKAPPGIYDQYDTSNEVDAGGSSTKTSAWMVRLGMDTLDHVYGNGTTLNYSEFREETIFDSNDKKLRGLVSYLSGRVAVRLSNKKTAVRIKNIDGSSNDLTDALLFQALQKFRENKVGQPNAIFMTPRSHEGLRAARTATNPSGTPAPLLDNWEGIPIYVTNNLSNAETV